MSEPPRERPTEPDPTEVEEQVQEFLALELEDPLAFAQAIATNILDRDPVETAAFRDERLVYKSQTALKEHLRAHGRTMLHRRRRGSQKKKSTEEFLRDLNYELRILDNVITGIKAQKGIVSNSPNPRQRALRRLASENLAGDVAKGRFRELVIEETEAIKTRQREQKKARAKARREAKR